MVVLVSTIGEQKEPIYEGIRKIEFDDLVFLASPKTQKIANKMREEFKNLCDIQVIQVDPCNLDDCLNKLVKLYNDYDKAEIGFNISGGTKIMSLACFIVASFNSNDVFYVFKADEKMRIIKLPLLRFDIEKVIKRKSRGHQILKLIYDEKAESVTNIAKKLKIKKATVSAHIKKLKEKYGLIRTIKETGRNEKISLSSSGYLLLELLEAKK
jgi:CRISPR locus-related DNA-binding protein